MILIKLFNKFHKQFLTFHLVTKILCAEYFLLFYKNQQCILLQQKDEAEIIMNTGVQTGQYRYTSAS